MSRNMISLDLYLQVYPDDGLNGDSRWIDVLTKYVHYMNQCKRVEITKTITLRAQKLERIASTYEARAKTANEKWRGAMNKISAIQDELGPQDPTNCVIEIRQEKLYSQRRTLESFVAIYTSAIRGELQTQACDTLEKLSDPNSLAPLTYEVGVRTKDDGSKEIDLVQMKAYVIDLLNQQIRSAYLNAMHPGNPPVLDPDKWNLDVVKGAYTLSARDMPKIAFNFHPPEGMQMYPQCAWNDSDLKKLIHKISPSNTFSIENPTGLRYVIDGKVGEVSLIQAETENKNKKLFGGITINLFNINVPKYTYKPMPDVLLTSQNKLIAELARLNEDITRKESELQILETDAERSEQESRDAKILLKFATLLSRENPKDAVDLLRIAKATAIGLLPFDTQRGEVDPKLFEILCAKYDSEDIHDLYEDVWCMRRLDIGLEEINSNEVEYAMLKNGLKNVLIRRLRHLSKYRVEMIEREVESSTVEKRITEYAEMYRILSDLGQFSIAQEDAGPNNKFNALMSPEEVRKDFKKLTQK